MLVVTMPVYNEEAGIAEFLRAIDAEFAGEPCAIVVVDDQSTDGTLDVVGSVGAELNASLVVAVNDRNLGHGPTCLRAYREALKQDATTVLHVDGDGQFATTDMRMVAHAVASAENRVAQGIRSNRVDPWFRKTLTRLVAAWVRVGFGAAVADANTPLRAFQPRTLARFLERLPDDVLVPNIYLSVLAANDDISVVDIPVRHLERADGGQGTMRGNGRPILIPRRLMTFVGKAARESLSMRHRLRDAGGTVRPQLHAARSAI